MPGRIVKVLVAKGDKVKADDPVLIIEAMKMENRLPSPIAGTVAAIYVNEGDDVKPDETLVQLE
jgi:pyruvate carboxylase subunit B